MFSLSSLSRLAGSTAAHASSTVHRVTTALGPLRIFARNRSQLAPRQVQHIKRHKGRIPIPTGGSTKGTTLAYGDWGIRIKGNGARLTAKQLTTAEDVIKRKIKVIKGSKVYLRVFPDIPVCIKGNETRMGKGKGTFEYWATRVPTGRVIFEIGGTPIREELARDALRQAADKLPTVMEFIDRNSPPRLGNLLLHPPKPSKVDTPIPAPESLEGAVPQLSA
ncbi:putative universal ribosomal protein uL16 family protein [Lyophyllum shimeji]|uniref:Universal ribosomal protein uL16 family protein n=1 Tax=Lyophyllum shimeji TaxID=47721 RepID=A0A9P3PPH4_LYOSH|nr:putative universal ribosomal protein uL16 family protein [Lyophyllum shimeji]